MKRLTIVFTVCLFVLVCVSAAVAQSTIQAGIVNGKAVSLPRPVYSDEARAAGLEGTVFVDVVIDESGDVISAAANTEPRKLRGADMNADEVEIPVADPILRDAAEQAALKAKFSPTLVNGPKVRVAGTLIYKFVQKTATSNISGGILNGKATSLPKPVYPAAAIAVRAAGTVAVQVLVDENGEVVSAEVMSGHPLLRSAAVEAARAASFSPTMLKGQPVKVSGVIVYNFVVPDTEN